MSFEFGGIASLGYGPLQGTAYVTTGAYVRKNGWIALLLPYSRKASHIGCFGIRASFTLRLCKRDGDIQFANTENEHGAQRLRGAMQ